MSARPLPLDQVKLSEGGRMRVPLSLRREDVQRLDDLAQRLDVDRATAARMLLLAAFKYSDLITALEAA